MCISFSIYINDLNSNNVQNNANSEFSPPRPSGHTKAESIDQLPLPSSSYKINFFVLGT